MNPTIRRLHEQIGIPVDYESTTLLPAHSTPTTLVSIGKDIYGREQRLIPEAAKRWQAMVEAAAADEQTLLAVSAYRSPDYQVEVIQRLLNKGETIDAILTRVAAPGYSEHHSGRAIDLTTTGYEAVEEEFEQSEAFEWLSSRANEFGFRLSYPRDNPLGVIYEPWHWCYQIT